MRSWASLAALLAVVVALGAWIYYKPQATPSATYALSALKPGDVKRLRLERPEKATSSGMTDLSSVQSAVLLVRQGDEWLMTTPFVARAEKIPVERMLSILDARSTVQYAATDLARYGLDKPQAVLTLEDQNFAFGAINNMTREQYVLTRNEIYLVPLAYITSLPRDADALLALRLFSRDETPVRFEFSDFTAVFRDGAWTISPNADETSADERNAWADAWRQASATRAARSDKGAATQDITILLKDGRTVSLGVVQRESELVLVRRDEGIAYHFFGDSGKKLLARPGVLEPTNK